MIIPLVSVNVLAWDFRSSLDKVQLSAGLPFLAVVAGASSICTLGRVVY